MRRRSDCTAICSSNWVTGSTSTGGVTTFHAFRVMAARTYKTLQAEMNTRSYVHARDYEAKRSQERAMDDESLLRGYSVRHYSRMGGVNAFIDLTLSRRCRREARTILATAGEGAALQFIIKLASARDFPSADYLYSVRTQRHMAQQRANWLRYIATSRTDSREPAKLRQLQSA